MRLVNKSGDVVHYNYMKDYKGNAHKCLMAKTAMGDGEDQSSHDKVKVTPRLNSFSLACTPSDEYLDAEDHYEDNDLDWALTGSTLTLATVDSGSPDMTLALVKIGRASCRERV